MSGSIQESNKQSDLTQKSKTIQQPAEETLETTSSVPELLQTPSFATPDIQSTVDRLQRLPSEQHRQSTFRTIQRTYGNAYAARVAKSSTKIIQRHPEGFTPTVDPGTAVDEIENPSPETATATASASESTSSTPAAPSAEIGAETAATAPSADSTPATGSPAPAPAPAPATPQAMSLATAQTVLQNTYGTIHQIVPGSIVLLNGRPALWARYDQAAAGAMNTHVNPPRLWQPGDAQQFIPTLEGFADHGTVFVNQNTPLVTATAHEMLHNNTAAGFRSRMGESINEGTTEYLAIKALNAAGVATPSGSTAYPNEVALVTALINLIGENPLKQAYFNGGNNIQSVIGDVDIGQGAGTFATMQDMAAAGNWTDAMNVLKPGHGTQQEVTPITDGSSVVT